MKPTHAQREFTATRQFTDRDDERNLFLGVLRERQALDTYRVLSWYGVGGQGKSALSREFMRLAAEQGDKVAAARINLDDLKMRRVEDALLSIRLQLSQSFGHRFGAFDTAFARHFVLTNPGVNIRQRHPELFRGENPLLDDLIDWSEAGVDALVEGVTLAVPGLNLLYKYLSRLSSRTREWYERRGKVVLRGLDDFTADELLDRLPSYLGSDICDLLERRPHRCLVVVDTHEALWQGHTSKDPNEGGRADAWLRLFVQDAPGVLFTIFGRDKLKWSDIDSDWSEIVESHLLGGLSKEDADSFLRAVPISSATVRRSIVDGAKGLPFYLDIQVDLFERLMMGESYPDPQLFGGAHPDILRRFLDHIGDGERKALRLASYPTRLTEAVINGLAQEFLGGIGHVNWGQLTRFSFMRSDGQEAVLMHDVMREDLQAREREERPEMFRTVHNHLFERNYAVFRDKRPNEIRSEHEEALEASLHHWIAADLDVDDDFFSAGFKSFIDAHRYGCLERTYRLLSKHQAGETQHKTLPMRWLLAQQIGNQGRYREAEEEFRAIWE
ncbi:hypothetical protein EEB11_19310, partial [Pseudotabrizicola sediminis]